MTESTAKPKKGAPSALTKSANTAVKERKPTRLDQLQELITREGGASIAEMCEVTGWQQHSVRGALAGELMKRGLTISSEKIDGVRRYSAKAAA